MGIMTVTGMSSIVAGLNASMARQIATLGSSTIFIRPQAPGENIDDDEWRRRKGLTMDEVAAIAEKPASAGGRAAAVDPDRDREVRDRARARPAGAGHHRGLRGRPRQLRREGPLPLAQRRRARGAGGGDRHRHRGRALPVRRAGGQGAGDRRAALRGRRRAEQEGPLPVPQHGQRAAGSGQRDPEAGPRASTS